MPNDELNGPATDLRGIRRRCRMGPLERSELEDFFVETAAGRDPERGLRHVLKLKLEDDSEELKILVYGHGGWLGVHPLVIENLRELGRIK